MKTVKQLEVLPMSQEGRELLRGVLSTFFGELAHARNDRDTRSLMTCFESLRLTWLACGHEFDS